MGNHTESQEWLRYQKEHAKDYELKTTAIKKIFNIPILYIKQSKYEKIYSLFNLLSIAKIVNCKGFDK